MNEWTPERAQSFGRVAIQYERGRPEYPRDAVSWLLEHAPDGRVVDLGAGTGKLTRVLVEFRPDIVAVEPLDELRQILEEVVPDVAALSGTAEAIPAEDQSVAAVTVGQAFHWFNPELALPEIARVLSPDGVLGVLWNLSDETVPWIHEFAVILGTEGLGGRTGEIGRLTELESSRLFGSVEFATFRHVPYFSTQALMDYVFSVSRVAMLPDDEQQAVREQAWTLLSNHPDIRGREPIAFPQVTSTIRARRDSSPRRVETKRTVAGRHCLGGAAPRADQSCRRWPDPGD